MLPLQNLYRISIVKLTSLLSGSDYSLACASTMFSLLTLLNPTDSLTCQWLYSFRNSFWKGITTYYIDE